MNVPNEKKLNHGIPFDKEKISSYLKVSKEMLFDFSLEIGHNDSDFIMKELTVKLDAFMASYLSEKKLLTMHCNRPTFFDWLFRRRKIAKFDLNVKDIILNPPIFPERTSRLYIIDQLNEI